MSACGEHGRLCAYTGEEPDRCPWCHCLWAHILARGAHSCESYYLWRGHRNPTWRVRRATAMRRQAAIKVQESAEQGRAGGWDHRGPERPSVHHDDN